MNNYSVDMALNIKSTPMKNASNKIEGKGLAENNTVIDRKFPNSKKDEFKKLLEKNVQNEKADSSTIKDEDTLGTNKDEDTLGSKDVMENNQVSTVDGEGSVKNIKDINLDNVLNSNLIASGDSVDLTTDANNQEELILQLLQSLFNGKIDLQSIKTESLKNPQVLEELSKKLTLDIVAMLKQQFSLPDMKVNKLNESINKEILSLLSESLSEGNLNSISTNDILSNLSKKISKDIFSNNIDPQLRSIADNQLDLKGKIKEILQAKVSKDENIQETDLQVKGNIINNSTETKKELSKSSGKEEKFLKELASVDKSDVDTKVDKVANFINGFNKDIAADNTTKIPQSINATSRETFINDVIKSIKIMDENNIKEMTVKIVPKELGEVIIKLTMENGLMKANISTSNKEAYNLLNSNLQDISSKISNTEIKIQNFALELYNGDTTFFSKENSKEDRRQNESNAIKQKSKGSSIPDEIENAAFVNTPEKNNLNAFV